MLGFRGLWAILFLVVTAASSAYAERFTVGNDGPSLFFANGPATADFDFRAWTANRALYRQAFATSPDRWDAAAPVPTRGRTLTRAEAELLLVRYQKPGGLEARRDLPILRAVLASRVADDHPRLVAGALQNLVSVSPGAYERLVDEYPRLRELRAPNGASPFRTQAEEKTVVRACGEYVDRVIKAKLPNAAAGSELADWTHLFPLAPALNQLPQAERSAREDSIMESIVNRASAGPLKGVFPSIVAHLAEQVTNPIFGDTPEDRTTLEMVRHPKSVTPMILGTQPIKGLAEKKNEFGFYVARLSTIPVAKDMPEEKREFVWEHGGRHYTAKADLKIVGGTPRGPIIPAEPSPRYDELWRPRNAGDQPTLTGLVVFGSNIASDAEGTARTYGSYLKSRGFVLDRTARLADTKAFLRDQIASGETAWFEKEAHSDGDDHNVFGVTREGEVRVYRLKHPDGRVEVVRIVLPKDDPAAKVDMVSNHDFGLWMRARARDAKKQLVFFNASCWSVDKGQNEIPEAHTRYLAEILSDGLTDYFFNRPDSGMRIVVEALRHGKSYAQIREALLRDPDYVDGSADQLVFPDEKRYVEKVMHHFSPLAIRVSIRSRKAADCGPAAGAL